MYSIYHFFAHLIRNKQQFHAVGKLEDFPFDSELISAKSDFRFPDLAIRINEDSSDFTGGELIELKDTGTYSIASFNSTIPTGKKDIHKLIPKPSGTLYTDMTLAGDQVYSLPIRDVFYLIRGRNKRRNTVKVCLVHGSFFETVKVDELIRQAFSQVFEERIESGKVEVEEALKELLLDVFSDQETFSKTRDVENASVNLRFRVMTEAKSEGNILNPRRYPEITDNTLSLIVPCHSPEIEAQERDRIRKATSETEAGALRIFKIKHLLNGEFLVFQTDIGTPV
ncbi:MAG: hypothetical protein ABI835_15485 [Chloroflexota bacterium]